MNNNWEDTAGTVLRCVLAIIILCLLAAMAGCSDVAAYAPSTLYDVNGRYVREFRLTDGTRCVAASGGITCDWGHQAPTVTMPAAGAAYLTAEGQLSWQQ